jgi:hypothetical protein
MKLFGVETHASMDMSADPVLREQLTGLVRRHHIDIAIETGTFLGAGSTRFTAEALSAAGAPKRFVTIEVNFANWCRAKANLRPYPFVDARWGLSVNLDRALKFLQHDEMLLHHERYPDIYIDSINDPVTAYSRELRGAAEELERMPLSAKSSDIAFDGKDYLYDGEDLLARLLAAHADHTPLIVLDSAGGIGFLEFQIVLEQMARKRFAILLDDTHHIKHWRSLQHIRSAPGFGIVAAGPSWALATHLLGD